MKKERILLGNKMDIVRCAIPEDSDKIVKIFHNSLPRKIIPLTIFGCKGVAQYIYRTIKLQKYKTDSIYIVYVKKLDVIGAAEFRRDADRLILNYISMLPAFRGKGFGQKLLFEGIKIVRDLNINRVELDVFSNNHHAINWYSSLGFKVNDYQIWIESPIPSIMIKKEKYWWCLLGLPQAEQSQKVFGFSNFKLETKSGIYIIGKLGATLFRCKTFNIFYDKAALAALHSINTDCKLLCIDSKKNMPKKLDKKVIVIAKSQHMIIDVDLLLSKNTNER